MKDESELRDYLIETYRRSLAFGIDCIYDNYVYTYDEDLDELNLVYIDTSMNTSSTLEVLDIFDVISNIKGLDTSITSLHLGGRVKRIAEHAFSYTSLTEVIVEFSEIPLTIDDFAFSSCTQLINFQCNRIYKINSYAFSFCTNLSEINLSTVVYIGRKSFDNNRSLNKINLNSIVELDESSFSLCNIIENK